MRSARFSDDVVRMALLWCGRHCCVCGKQCGVHIETHHLDPKGEPDQDNCLPVCYDCHGTLSHYDSKQPRGRKFRLEELKARREQIYEQHTRHLVPPTNFIILHHPHGLPKVRFRAQNLGDYPPVKATIVLTVYVDGVKMGIVKAPHYDGTIAVNLNPRHGFNGWFELAEPAALCKRRLLIKIDVRLFDPYKREHPLLPFGYIHKPGSESWYYEPSPEAREIIEGP